jgi:hypothetical protein
MIGMAAIAVFIVRALIYGELENDIISPSKQLISRRNNHVLGHCQSKYFVQIFSEMKKGGC